MAELIPVMTPAPGNRLQRFVGDCVRFTLRDQSGRAPARGWRALLRTNLGRAEVLRREILQAHTQGLPLAGASWRDVPMHVDADGWSLEIPLAEVGYFKAKAYLLDPRGWQHWPDGPDTGISVHPDAGRTGNIIYCAFARLFGATRTALNNHDDKLEQQFKSLDATGYAVIPPSGKLRDLRRQLPHIFEKLGCRILHLLPIHPTPTTFARYGRFGSPYAALDLTAIDPALVEFDQRTTGVEQFVELTRETHRRGGRVVLDIVINHTGWGSVLQERHPEWFVRQPDGRFASPGAWGTVWEDLVELKHVNVALWDELADIFLTWCRRGVDGFRCDAGYMVPVAAWQYIIARVQQEHPGTIFLLEGLGGAWDATAALLTEGGMQWAYSELFQNYSPREVSGYLDHALARSREVGLLVHYSETHDNERLAARGRAWSLLRNRLCALASVSGGFGFTCGVEWLAAEKIRVHGSTGLAWDSRDNLVPELARLNRLLSEHPCFFDGARLARLSAPDSSVYALRRESAEGKDIVLVLANLDLQHPQTLDFAGERPPSPLAGDLAAWTDLLGQPLPEIRRASGGHWRLTLAPGTAFCLAPAPAPAGLAGEDYRRARARAAWALAALNHVIPAEKIGPLDWRQLAAEVDRSPADFLAAISHLDPAADTPGLHERLQAALVADGFPRVATWTRLDARRITPVPPAHWLLLEDSVPFRAELRLDNGGFAENIESIPARGGHVACFAPRTAAGEARLRLERCADDDRDVGAAIRFLPPEPVPSTAARPRATDIVLLTNGRGGMARLCVDLGHIRSKYDCVLGANLHPSLPVDRHVLAKRLRVWVNADGFISPLDYCSLATFEPGPPAIWHFIANAGDGRTVEVQATASMLPDRNTVVFHFTRPTARQAAGKQLPATADVRLTVRLDLEDRGFHQETRRNGGAEHHFTSHTRAFGETASPATATGRKTGFEFTPAPDRHLRVFTGGGSYHHQPEWSNNIPHPIEQSRGQEGSGDAWSPGWFELPLPKGASLWLVVTADPTDPAPAEIERACGAFHAAAEASPRGVAADEAWFGRSLERAARDFVVRRDSGKTVIAGYPWFLDWGRDTFICARGLLAAGMLDEVQQIVLTFARFEKDGTLPNTIFGSDASNRDTSDAPLWFGVVCEELAGLLAARKKDAAAFYAMPVDPSGRTLLAVLRSIAQHYLRGTPNGIRVDQSSGLVWSPSHFTWMDTNYPAATPREGYPVEIQALWVRLLRQLARLELAEPRWAETAARAAASIEKFFWSEDHGWYGDVLPARAGQGAAGAVLDAALRSNCLFLVSLGLAEGSRARRCVEAARRYLVVPGALRSLAPLPVSLPLPVRAADGRLLNDSSNPYWGRYEGDEDTRRKPAYHNGTAWTWTFPVWCEALARAWNFSPDAMAAARACLGSMSALMDEGCLGHLPEIVDGDSPHTQRGCDAQAWAATEALRVWHLLSRPPS